MRIIITAYVRFANALAWHALEVACGLQNSGHEVLLFCQRSSPLAVWAARESLAYNDSFNLNHFWPGEMARALASFRNALSKFRPDVLNPHCPPGHSYLQLARSLEHKPNIPLVRTVADPRPPKRNLLNARLLTKQTDAFIFSSTEMRRRYLSVFPRIVDRSQVILPGFRADDFVGNISRGTWRAKLNMPDDSLLLGIVARMSPEKGQEVFLQALTKLSTDEQRRIVCVMAGEDSRERDQKELAAEAQCLKVTSPIIFPGKLDDVRPLIADLDIGLVTSVRSEAVCRVALEYMSFGVPVIAADTNILPDVVHHGDSGWLYPAHDASALATCLREALQSRDEIRQRGENGYRLVHSQLSLDRELQETLATFERARQAARRM